MLLASEEREIPMAAVDLAARIAEQSNAPVHVFTIARVWGTGFGFPNPGLMPTRHEWDEQRLLVREAVSAFEKAGFEASGWVLATRRARKRILQEAARRKIDAIVMGADPDRGILGDFAWQHEPYRVARRSKRIPVYLEVLS